MVRVELLRLTNSFRCDISGLSVSGAGQLPCAVTTDHIRDGGKSGGVENAAGDGTSIAALAMDENGFAAVEFIEPFFQLGKRNGDRSWN